MVIDTSALLSILLQEADAALYAAAIEAGSRRLLSSASYLETSIVLTARFGAAGVHDFDHLLRAADIEIVPFTAEQAEWARVGYERYGKGQHAAGLNYGDCFIYGLAKVSGEAVLCKGEDFARTDVALVALPSAAADAGT
jgi:ribonuclease VapC